MFRRDGLEGDAQKLLDKLPLQLGLWRSPPSFQPQCDSEATFMRTITVKVSKDMFIAPTYEISDSDALEPFRRRRSYVREENSCL
jgi:hypothetical protein